MYLCSPTYPPQGPRKPVMSSGLSFLFLFFLSKGLFFIVSNTDFPTTSSGGATIADTGISWRDYYSKLIILKII